MVFVSSFLVRAVGLAAGTGTTVSFLPQVARVFRTRSVADLSPTMFLIHSSGVVLWVAYGVLVGDWIIVGFNVATLCFNAAILSFFLCGGATTTPSLPVVASGGDDYGAGGF